MTLVLACWPIVQKSASQAEELTLKNVEACIMPSYHQHAACSCLPSPVRKPGLQKTASRAHTNSKNKILRANPTLFERHYPRSSDALEFVICGCLPSHHCQPGVFPDTSSPRWVCICLSSSATFSYKVLALKRDLGKQQPRRHAEYACRF